MQWVRRVCGRDRQRLMRSAVAPTQHLAQHAGVFLCQKHAAGMSAVALAALIVGQACGEYLLFPAIREVRSERTVECATAKRAAETT